MSNPSNEGRVAAPAATPSVIESKAGVKAEQAPARSGSAAWLQAVRPAPLWGVIVVLSIAILYLLSGGKTQKVEVEILGQKLSLDDGQRTISEQLKEAVRIVTEERESWRTQCAELRNQLATAYVPLQSLPLRFRDKDVTRTIEKLNAARWQLDQFDADIYVTVAKFDRHMTEYKRVPTNIDASSNAVIGVQHSLLAKLLFATSYLADANAFTREQLEAAVKSLQRRHNLREDGVIGTKTWPKLKEEVMQLETS